MISCHPVNPKARITVLLRWGKGRGRGSYTPPFWGGGFRVGDGMGGMSIISSPKRFGIVSYHPVIPTAGTTDPSRVGGREGGGVGTGGQEPENKSKIQSTI